MTKTTNWWLPGVAATRWRKNANAMQERSVLSNTSTLPVSAKSSVGLVLDGTTVTMVIPHSPSSKEYNGQIIEPGDVVTHVDKTPVADHDCIAKLRGHDMPGSRVCVTVVKKDTLQASDFMMTRADIRNVLASSNFVQESSNVEFQSTSTSAAPHSAWGSTAAEDAPSISYIARTSESTCQCQHMCQTCGLPIGSALRSAMTSKMDLIIQLLCAMGVNPTVSARDLMKESKQHHCPYQKQM